MSEGHPGAAPAPAPAPGGLRRLAVRTAVITGVVVGICVAVLLVWSLRAVLGLIFIGFFLALGLDPAVSALERRVHRRGLAVLVLVLLLLLALVVFAVIVITPAVTQLGDLGGVLTREVPRLVAEAQDSHSRIGQLARRPAVANALQSVASSLPNRITGWINSTLSLVGSIFGGIVKGLAVVALTLYFVSAMPRILQVGGNLVGGGEHEAVLRVAASKVGGYVTGQLAVCACAAIAAGVYFFATGVPYAMVLALAVGVLDAVPQIGATAGAIVGIVAALTVSPELALVTLLFFLAYQQTENYLIAPRLMSQAVNVSAPAVLIAVLIGAGLGGVVGAVAALPLTAAGKTVLAYYAGRRFARVGVDLGPAMEPPREERPRLVERMRRRLAAASPAAAVPTTPDPPAAVGSAGGAAEAPVGPSAEAARPSARAGRPEVAEAPEQVEDRVDSGAGRDG